MNHWRRAIPRPRLRTTGLLAGLLLLGISSGLFTGCSGPAPAMAELSGPTMGTRYSIKLAPPPHPQRLPALQQRIDDLLAGINRQMSTYQADSDLMQFNRQQSTDWQPVPPGLVELVELADTISRRSAGAYDVTVGPLVALWGFGATGTRSEPPRREQIEAELARVGYRHLQSRRQPPMLRKTIAALEIDLSSIAKGWAVDRIASLLRDEGFSHFLVEIGGELVAQGEKAPGVPWRIAIERPLPGQREVQRIVALHDTAVATSGDYRNFFEKGGKRFSHTVDPVTGQSVQHRLASVTVFADDCASADAWATALMALGDQRAPQIAEQQQLKAFFIIRETDGFRELSSPALDRLPGWHDTH